MSYNSVCNHTRDKQIGLPLRGRPILLSLVGLQTELDSTQSYYHYLFVVRVASFAPERSKGANDVSLLSIHKAKSLYASEF